MKRILALPVTLVSFIALLSACKKSSSASYSFTANVGGTSTSFNQAAYAVVEAPLGQPVIIVQGVANGQAGKSLMLSVSNSSNTNPIVKGHAYVDTDPDWNVEGIYSESGTSIFFAGNDLANAALNSGVTIAHHLTVTFTSIDSTSVKGTFSGDFFQGDDPHGKISSFTNGTFNVKIQR
ncbi:MAG: hypothetical protein Q8927_01290 [Bacteroidota bacterium]|nr:hypothetical protein [Bacteroidota bacterium]MDP4214803.1 hypothetical protein [Bacteroidota bacterium]MDP4246824.1 hypothetical protein [Bacteroidota bacterium]MDP4255984.1 hypothetical protein [Bacteroidota bacterium]MDP4259001.1 hypothetical protein [Bacteroidota bacterium]